MMIESYVTIIRLRKDRFNNNRCE